MQFRIKKQNRHSWVLEEFTQNTNPFTKKPGKGKWIPIAYCGKLKDLADYLLDKSIEVPEGDLAEQIPIILKTIKEAEERIILLLENKQNSF